MANLFPAVYRRIQRRWRHDHRSMGTRRGRRQLPDRLRSHLPQSYLWKLTWTTETKSALTSEGAPAEVRWKSIRCSGIAPLKHHVGSGERDSHPGRKRDRCNDRFLVPGAVDDGANREGTDRLAREEADDVLLPPGREEPSEEVRDE